MPSVPGADDPSGTRPGRVLAARVDPAPPIGIDAGIGGIVQQGPQRHPVRPAPFQGALVRPLPQPDAQLDVVVDEIAQHTVQRAEPLELREDQPDHGLHLLVRVEGHIPGRAADVTAGQGEGQLAAAGLVQAPAPHPLLDQVEFGLTHRALEPQQQPVVVLARVVDTVGVREHRTRQGAQLDQLVPVPAAAGQAGHLDPPHETDMVQPDLGDQTLETGAGHRTRPRLAQVLVDHQDPVRLPAQRDRPVHQGVLQPGRLLMVDELLAGGLADIDHREPLQMTVVDLAAGPLPRHHRGHRRSRSLAVAMTDNARLASRTNCPTTACRLTSGSAAHTRPSGTTGIVFWGRRHCRRA